MHCLPVLNVHRIIVTVRRRNRIHTFGQFQSDHRQTAYFTDVSLDFAMFELMMIFPEPHGLNDIKTKYLILVVALSEAPCLLDEAIRLLEPSSVVCERVGLDMTARYCHGGG